MPAPRKYPDELRRRAIGLTPGRPGRPGPAWGVFAARGRRAGGRPRDPARPGSARGFGSVAGDRPGTTTEGARRTGEPASGSARAGGGPTRSCGARRLSSRRSVSALPADLRLHRPAQGGDAGPAPGLHRPDRVRVQDRPVHLLRRPVPPALQEVDLGRRPGREDPRPEGRAVQRDAGIQEDLAAAGLPAGGPPGGPVHRGAAHAGAGTDRRRAGQDSAHHRARQGEPGPRRPAAPRLHRRPVRTGAGWSTSCATRRREIRR